MKRFIFNFINLLLGATMYAQGVFFENINHQYGLPSENIYDIYKDSKGYIWSTSEIGLLRFNGKSFQVFDNSSNLSKSGSYIKEDKLGRIWYQSFDGYFFYVENDSLKQLHSKESSGFKSYSLNSKFLFRVIDNGIVQIDLTSLKQNLLIKGNNFVFCHLIDEWLYYGNQVVYRYHLTQKKIEKVCNLNRNFKSLITFSNDRYIAFADRSTPKTPFIILDNLGIHTQSFLDLPETLQNVYLLPNEIWCFTKNGIYRFDYQMKPLQNSHFLEGKNVSSYTNDSNNFIWIGSPTNGMYVIKDLSSHEFYLENDEFSSISNKDKKIYTGTNSGKIYAHSLDLKTELFFDTGENNHILYLDFKTFKDWIFFTGNGFYAQNIKENKVNRNYTSVKEITKINDTTLGIAATGYAGKMDIHSIANEEILKKNIITNLRAKSCVYSASKETLYIASNKGLFSIDKENTISQIQHHNQNVFAKKIVNQNDTLWGITNNGKLFYNKDKLFNFINQKIIFSHIKIFNNQIYLGTNNEIYNLKGSRIQKINSIGRFNPIIDFEIIGQDLYI
ncbi:two-component regulator propeller domain-containing protein, partial [Flavobacterium sp. 9AF]|uniref:two-component regulator propeller domain-containing protein n=1 Tax=Flavobacterium sp. 9AF TaxID=2653142 RepID=UPI0013593B1D